MKNKNKDVDFTTMGSQEIVNYLIKQVIQITEDVHKGQTRRGSGLPYATHPLRVGNRIPTPKKVGLMLVIKVAAYLHDTLEDTKLTSQGLLNLLESRGFSRAIAYKVVSIVQELTKTKGQKWDADKLSKPAKYIKLLDRIDNLIDGAKHLSGEWLKNYLANSRKLYQSLRGTDYLLEKELLMIMDTLDNDIKTGKL